MKKRKLAILLLIAAVAIGMTSYAAEKQETPKKKQQTHCAVMRNNPINTNLYVDVKGKRIYVCCPGCIPKIKADPDKYIKQLEAQGITIEKAPMMQTTCPVLGGKINKNLYADVNGKRIYVCCPMCIGKIKANPEKYIKQMEAKGITLANTPKQEAPKQDK